MLKTSRFMLKLICIGYLLLIVSGFVGCSSLAALKDINDNPNNASRGNPENTNTARDYLRAVLNDQEGREVRAYHRRAYSPDNKKNMFLFHSYYVFFKDGKAEHSLVFTATPKGSDSDGNWMIDAESDLDSYLMYAEGDNRWEVEPYINKQGSPTLHLEHTVEAIIDRIDAGYTFFGPASVRNLPWYHKLWVSLTPPPFVSLASILLISIKQDNCSSAVLETMRWV